MRSISTVATPSPSPAGGPSTSAVPSIIIRKSISTASSINPRSKRYVGLTGTFGGVTVGGYVYHDFTLKATTVQGNVGYGMPISDKVSCNFAVNLGYVSPDDGGDYTYYGASVQLPWKISDQATLTVGGSYATNDIDGAEDDIFWVNAGFTYTF